MPNPFFADLVRETSSAVGTGPLTLSGALPGHRSFSATVPSGAQFHYAIAGVSVPGEWEVGTGSINGSGQLVRETVAASSADGMPVNFSPGLKTAALTVGSGWFEDQQAQVADLASAVAGKQPVSTGLGATGVAEASDTVTIRRGSGWFNLALDALVRRGAGGRFIADGAVDVAPGSATAVGLGLGSGSGTGLFSPAAGAIAVSTGASERVRVDSNGNVGIGTMAPANRLQVAYTSGSPSLTSSTQAGLSLLSGSTSLRIDAGSYGAWPFSGWLQAHNGAGSGFAIALNPLGGNVGVGTDAPASRLHVHSAVAEAFRVTTPGARGTGNLYQSWYDATGRKGYIGYGANDDSFFIANEVEAPVFIQTGGANRLIITNSGTWSGLDNAASLGAPSVRWSVVYAATGVINTSDAREKTWRGALNAAEMRAAARIAREIGAFQWNDAIADKGRDRARFHIGVRAQAVWTIMADEGLVDPITADNRPGATPYAFLCWDKWDDGGRFGVRTDQLALFVAAGQEQRLAAIEDAR